MKNFLLSKITRYIDGKLIIGLFLGMVLFPVIPALEMEAKARAVIINENDKDNENNGNAYGQGKGKGKGSKVIPANVKVLFDCERALQIDAEERKKKNPNRNLVSKNGAYNSEWFAGGESQYCDTEGECFLNSKDKSCAGDCFSLRCPSELKGMLSIEIDEKGSGSCTGSTCDADGNIVAGDDGELNKEVSWSCAENKAEYLEKDNTGYSDSESKTRVGVGKGIEAKYFDVWCPNGGYLDNIDRDNPKNSTCSILRCVDGSVSKISKGADASVEEAFNCEEVSKNIWSEQYKDAFSSPSVTAKTVTDEDGVEYSVSCPDGYGNLNLGDGISKPLCYKPSCNIDGNAIWGEEEGEAIVERTLCPDESLALYTQGGVIKTTFTAGDGNKYTAKCPDNSYNILAPAEIPKSGDNSGYVCSVPACSSGQLKEVSTTPAEVSIIPCDEEALNEFVSSSPSTASYTDEFGDTYFASCPNKLSAGIFKNRQGKYKCNRLSCDGSNYKKGETVDAFIEKTGDCGVAMADFFDKLGDSSPSVSPIIKTDQQSDNWEVSCPTNSGSLNWNRNDPEKSTCKPAVCSSSNSGSASSSSGSPEVLTTLVDWDSKKTVLAIVSNMCGDDNDGYGERAVTWEENGDQYSASCPAGSGAIELVTQKYNEYEREKRITKVETFIDVPVDDGHIPGFGAYSIDKCDVKRNHQPSGRYNDYWEGWSCNSFPRLGEMLICNRVEGFYQGSYPQWKSFGCFIRKTVTKNEVSYVNVSKTYSYKRPFCRKKEACVNGRVALEGGNFPNNLKPNTQMASHNSATFESPTKKLGFNCDIAITNYLKSNKVTSGYDDNSDFWNGGSKFSCGSGLTQKEKTRDGYNCYSAKYSCKGGSVIVEKGKKFSASFDCQASVDKYKADNPLTGYVDNSKTVYKNAEVSCGGGLTKMSVSGGPIKRSVGDKCSKRDQWGVCKTLAAFSEEDKQGLEVNCTRPKYSCENNKVVYEDELFTGSAKWKPKKGYVCYYNKGGYTLANDSTTYPGDGVQFSANDNWEGDAAVLSLNRKLVTEGDVFRISPRASNKVATYVVGADYIGDNNNGGRVDIGDIIVAKGTTQNFSTSISNVSILNGGSIGSVTTQEFTKCGEFAKVCKPNSISSAFSSLLDGKHCYLGWN